jgi:hypothetical protein
MARSKTDTRRKDGTRTTMADPVAMDPLATMAYMVARDRLQERLAPSRRPHRSASPKQGQGWRDRAATRPRRMADRLESAGAQSRG